MNIIEKIDEKLNEGVIEEADAIVGEIGRNIASHALKNFPNYAVDSVKGNKDKIIVTIVKY